MKTKRIFGFGVKIAVCIFTLLAFASPAFAWQERFISRSDGLSVLHLPQNNPAFMTDERYISLRGNRSSVTDMHGAFILFEVGAMMPIGANQTLGFTALGRNASEAVTFDDGESFYDNHIAFMATYAINPIERWSFGANLSVHRTPSFTSAIYNLALDLGTTFTILQDFILGEHIVGLSVQNLISPNVSRPNDVEQEILDLPINIRAAYFAHLLNRQINLGMALDFNDVASSSDDFSDDQKSIEVEFAANLGIWLWQVLNIRGELATSHRSISATVNIPSPAFFAVGNLQFGYKYTNITSHSDSFMHSFSLRGLFGNRR